jgi:hypothetical protein
MFVALGIHLAKRLRLIALSSASVRLYQVFPHYLIKGAIYGKVLLNMKLGFDYSNNFLLKHFSL